MAKQILNVIFDTETSQIMVGGIPVTNELEREHVIKLLLAAANVMVSFRPPVIVPATHMPAIHKNGNTPPKVTH